VQDCGGRRDTFAVDAIVEELKAFEREFRRRRGYQHQSVRGRDASATERYSAARSKRLQVVDELRRADDIGDRIPRVNFMEVHVVRRDAVNARFGVRNEAENSDGLMADRWGQRFLQMAANVAPVRMCVPVSVVTKGVNGRHDELATLRIESL
jgi:hypothetical protein